MSGLVVKLKKLPHFDSSFELPRYHTEQAAGADIRASLLEGKGGSLHVAAGQRVAIPTGLAMEIPKGYEIQVRPRSGLSLKSQLLIVNAPGTIDSDYRGELKILVGNFGNQTHVIHHGDRLAQLVLAPVYQASFNEVEELCDTQRGSGGFGSTGVN